METSNKRVFILDDEVVIASTLAMILRSQGIDTTAFSEPLKAFEAARANAPHLIVSDMTMPKLSGLDFAIQIKAEFPDCKILLFSGDMTNRDKLEAARAQGHDFRMMMKPVYPRELLKRIRGLLDMDGRADG